MWRKRSFGTQGERGDLFGRLETVSLKRAKGADNSRHDRPDKSRESPFARLAPRFEQHEGDKHRNQKIRQTDTNKRPPRFEYSATRVCSWALNVSSAVDSSPQAQITAA